MVPSVLYLVKIQFATKTLQEIIMLQKSLFVLTLVLLVGCGEQERESSTNTVATTAAFNAADAPTVQFEVPDMMCEESCAKAVRETLAAQPGAKEVVVDFPKKLATVAVDEKTFSSDAALAALLDKQFTEAKLLAAPEKVAEPAAPEAPPLLNLRQVEFSLHIDKSLARGNRRGLVFCLDGSTFQ